VLVATLVFREQRTLRWSVVLPALWLTAPRSPLTGRRGGRPWLLVIRLVLASGSRSSCRRSITRGAVHRRVSPKRYRSALIGIAVHSAQSLLFIGLAFHLARG
jgi:hypothetical protein